MKRGLWSRTFLLLILGQLTSLFGNFILKLALSMYLLDVTGSATLFAGVLSLAILPTILLSPLGGILADRADRRAVMVALDTLSGGAVLCAALALSEKNDLVVISVLLVLLSILGAFETPTVQACIPSLLEGDDITKGNAIVNQVASLSYFTAPLLGSAFYAAFGLKPVMYASTGCFFATACLECFLKLGNRPSQCKGNLLSLAKQDFCASIHYLTRERRVLSELLLFTACARFFVMGVIVVGLPYLVRVVLGLDARYYGVAESTLAVATVLGSATAGVLSTRQSTRSLSALLMILGVLILPAGVVFLFPLHWAVRYAVSLLSFCGIQIAVTLFSIFAVSLIQQQTPDHLMGKVMAFTAALTLCVQPVGQVVYGFLFDQFRPMVFLVLLPTGVAVCAVGWAARGRFQRMDER